MVVYKRVSADEAHTKMKEKRPDMVRGDTEDASVAKAAVAPPSWNAQQRSARFVMSTQQVDRYGDIVVTSGGDLTEFLRNPVGLLFHQSRTWPVANWANVEVKSGTRPARMEGDFVLLPEGGPVKTVDEAAWMIENGGIRACSIGFIPNWDEVDLIMDDEEKWVTGFKFNMWELTECSVCSIPANAGALVKAAHGDTNLAKELLEDVLDNWVKTPEGLILSKADFEARLKEVNGGEKTIVEVRAGNIVIPDLSLREDGTRAKASSELIVDGEITTGKAISSQKLAEGAFTPENLSGGLISLPNANIGDLANGGFTDKDFQKSLDDFVATIKEGDKINVHATMEPSGEENGFVTFEKKSVTILVMRDGKEHSKVLFDNGFDVPEAFLTKCRQKAEAPKEEKLTLSVSADVTGAHKELDALNEKIEQTGKNYEGLIARVTKFFTGSKETQERVEPAVEVPPAPQPTEDEIKAARERAAAVHERSLAKGLISA